MLCRLGSCEIEELQGEYRTTVTAVIADIL